MILWLALGIVQDDTGKAKALLDAVAGEMKNAKAISFYCQIQRSGKEELEEIQVCLKRPNLGRFTFTEGEREYVYVLDGTTFWSYFADRNEYSKMAQTAEQEKSVWAGILPILFFAKSSDLPEFGKGVTCSRETEEDIPYDVVQWGPDGKYTVWIDPEKAVRKFRMRTSGKDGPSEKIVDCGDVELDPELEEDAFTFTPPKDAKEGD